MKLNDFVCKCNLCGKQYDLPAANNTICCGDCMKDYIKPNIPIVKNYYKVTENATVRDLLNKKIVIMPPTQLTGMADESFIRFLIQFCDVDKPVYGIVKKEDIDKFKALTAAAKPDIDHGELWRDLKKMKQLELTKRR